MCGGERDIYCYGRVPYVSGVDCVLVLRVYLGVHVRLCVRIYTYACVDDGLVSPRCRLLKWAELCHGQWSRGLTA